jgi:hypothetical protein
MPSLKLHQGSRVISIDEQRREEIESFSATIGSKGQAPHVMMARFPNPMRIF